MENGKACVTLRTELKCGKRIEIKISWYDYYSDKQNKSIIIFENGVDICANLTMVDWIQIDEVLHREIPFQQWNNCIRKHFADYNVELTATFPSKIPKLAFPF